MFIKAYHFLCGYVLFETVGEFPERLLNLFSKNRITVWDISRSDEKIEGKMTVKNYKQMRQIRKKCKVGTRVKNRFGAPFLIRKYRHRIGFVAGLVLFFATLHFLSGFVWNICVSGNETIPTETIILACKELGVTEGVKRNEIDSHTLSSKLALKVDGLAWASFNVEGSRLTVNVAERTDVKMKDNFPCNLVAKRDGIIEDYMIDDGNILIKRNQAVKAGDILVSGIIPNADGSSRFVASSGYVIATTERVLSYHANYVQTETVKVGKTKGKTVLKFFSFLIPLYLGEYEGNFETETKHRRFNFGDSYLPIEFTTKYFTEIEDMAYEASTEQATEIAREEIKRMEESELCETEIISSVETVEITDRGVRVTVKYKCKENIADEDLMLIYEE